jgi:hypothetical protein
VNDPDAVLLGFAAACRAGGLPVTVDRGQQFLRAAALAGAGSRDGVYWAGRSTLCAGPDDIQRYDRAFDAWFATQRASSATTRREPNVSRQPDLQSDADSKGDDESEEIAVRAVASSVEVLRSRDVARLTPAERRRLERLLDQLAVRPPRRLSLRRRPARRGRVDGRRTLRDSLHRAGEPGRLRHALPSTRPRRVVLLVDVSGSMEPYADHLLRLAHRVVQSAPASTEVFTVGTRLTRVSSALRVGDAGAALTAAGRVVPDWSGGTRLGEVLQVFLDRHGQRGMARGAVVVVFSDGWERGDPALLGEQALRLRRLTHRLLWVNPHRGKPGYQPVQAGIMAVVPAVDALLSGHSLATFEDLLTEVSRA